MLLQLPLPLAATLGLPLVGWIALVAAVAAFT